MSHEFPRRRHVRDMCEEMLHVLMSQSNEDGDFDEGFLNGVRDLMREGVPLEDAIGAFSPEYEDDPECYLGDFEGFTFTDVNPFDLSPYYYAP